MTTKTQRDLNLEYWGRVHDMCDAYNKEHGTNIKPQQCVKLNGKLWKHDHPVFDWRKYDLAVTIIEDTPVFIGDVLYSKDKGLERIIKGGSQTIRHIFTNVGSRDLNDLTLTPPKPQRTFELNGRQLPCPEKKFVNVSLEILGEDYFFNSLYDRNEVAKAINDLLEEARAKD